MATALTKDMAPEAVVRKVSERQAGLEPDELTARVAAVMQALDGALTTAELRQPVQVGTLGEMIDRLVAIRDALPPDAGDLDVAVHYDTAVGAPVFSLGPVVFEELGQVVIRVR